MFDLSQSGRFVWTDGSFWNYQIWTPGEPNHRFSNREDCVEMNWNRKQRGFFFKICNFKKPKIFVELFIYQVG